MNNESKIISTTVGASYPFLTKNIQPNANCNNGGFWNNGTWVSNCNVSGALASPLKDVTFISDPDAFPANPGGFPSYSGKNDLACDGAISPAAGDYKNASWGGNSCVATLKSGQTYRFDTLSISEGAMLNLNGATVYAQKMTIKNGYNSGVTGSGDLHVNDLTVTGQGKLNDARVTVYSTLEVSGNGNTGTAVFQPHYLDKVTMEVSASGQSVLMGAGDWFIKSLGMKSNSAMTFQGQSSLAVYGLKMENESRISAAGSRSDLTLQLHQTLEVSGNGTLNGYLQARYLKTFKHQSTSNINFYFRGGNHWIDKMELGQNDKLIFDSGSAARLYIKSDLALSDQMEVNAGGKANDLMMYHFGKVTMSGNTKLNAILYVNAGDLAMSGQAVLTGAVSAVNVSMTNNSQVIHEPFTGDWPGMCEDPLTCFSDDFSASTLGSDWVVAQRNGSTLPSLQNGRLRLTQNTTNQATSATFQRLFPGASNLVTIEFDQYAYKTSGSSGADGMAVVLSDATITPQPGAFGGPLGYGFKTGISGFAGGWMGVGIDEYGNYANEGGSYNPGSRPQAVSIRGSGASSGTSGYRYLAGTASNLSPAVDSGTNGNRPHRYRITIDSRTAGSSLASVERNTGSGYTMLVGPINMVNQTGQAAVPANFLLSLTGSTGSVTNYHELDNVRICALKSNPVGTQIDHFEFDHSGQALTCNPETLTIRACANASCSQLFTDPVSAILTPLKNGSNGWIAGSQVSYNGNTATVNFSGGTTTLQLRNNLATAITVGVSGSTPSTKPLSTTLCRAGSGALSAAACTLSFADSGFFFDVPDTYSNQPQTVTIKAVKKSDVTKLCVPGFASQTKSVKFWSSYITPASNPYNSQMSVNSSTIGASQGAATPLSLVFDAQGQSTITVNYPDAGKVQLDARYDGTGSEAGLVMLGADQFVARPVGLCITPPQGVCAAGDSSCPVFKKAGEAFQVDIKAMAWESANDGDICAGNLATPNFALPNIALGSTLVAPNPGTNATLGTTTYNHVAAANSLNSVSQTVSEVGVFRMTATPPANGYFNYTIPSAQSQPVGRFIPADFNLVSGDIVPACNAFSYMGQPFGVMLDVLARNTTGVQTRNYTGPFAKGEAYLSVANDKDGKSLSSRLRSLQPLPWLNGRAALTTGSSEFVRLSGTQPDGPYKSLLFGLYMRDNDGERTLIASPNFNDAVVGNCSGSGCNARQIDSVPMKAYFGRLQAGTAAGLASAPLAIPLQVQYYEAGNWLQNKEDQCTQLSLANQGFTFLNPSQTFDTATRELNLGAGRKIKLGLGSSAPGGDAALAKDGEILFNFAKPDISVRIPYKVDLSKQPSRPVWLSDPSSANDGNLQGEAIFGSSRGNDRIIYRREVMP
uniref:MshQ n=1 Tax=Aeromonas veronii bv. sobria TaxID=114517 RepID=H9NKW6_AERVE|nr:MshQ [Aeromonas veronii bv. sobria]